MPGTVASSRPRHCSIVVCARLHGRAGCAPPGPGLGRRDGLPFDLFVQSGTADGGGSSTVEALVEVGVQAVPVAPHESWGLEPHQSVGSPFAVPEPVLLTARHVPSSTLAARGAYLRVVEGLPLQYVLVEGSLWDNGRGRNAESRPRVSAAAGG